MCRGGSSGTVGTGNPEGQVTDHLQQHNTAPLDGRQSKAHGARDHASDQDIGCNQAAHKVALGRVLNIANKTLRLG